MRHQVVRVLIPCAVLCAVLPWCSFTSTAQAPAQGSEARRPDASFFFIQLTDPQMGMSADNADIEQETANLEFAVATINRLRPAFVVITGDLVNKTGDEVQIRGYLDILAKVNPAIPVHNVPGNHDVGNTPTPDTLSAYVKRFGPDHYTIRHGDFTGIIVNSQLMAAPQNAPDAAASQAAWLRSELDRARGGHARHIVVFQHHPVFLNDSDEADKYENLPREQRKKYLALLDEFGVKHVFAGHLHHNNVVHSGGLEIVGTGPIGKPLGDGARSGMRIVSVSDRGIEHRYYDLGELPNRLR